MPQGVHCCRYRAHTPPYRRSAQRLHWWRMQIKPQSRTRVRQRFFRIFILASLLYKYNALWTTVLSFDLHLTASEIYQLFFLIYSAFFFCFPSFGFRKHDLKRPVQRLPVHSICKDMLPRNADAIQESFAVISNRLSSIWYRFAGYFLIR